MIKLAGVEDAGRGPVIGPLVMAGVMIDKKDEPKLKAIGVKDSKLLTPQKREELFDTIKEIAILHKIMVVYPDEIDETLDGNNATNLNWLEADKSGIILTELEPDEAILDCPSPNIEAYTDYVKARVLKTVKIICEHKADLNHPVVGAASILAKVTRDREIAKIHAKIGNNFGSGYPADPITVEFIKKNWQKHPEIFRKSWKTYKKLVSDASQSSLDQF